MNTNMLPYEVLLKAVQNASVGGPNYWAAAVLVVGLGAFGFLSFWFLRTYTATIKAMRDDARDQTDAVRKDSKDQIQILVGVVRDNTTAITAFYKLLEANTARIEEVRRDLSQIRKD